MKKYILLTITLLSSVLLSAQTLYSSRHDSIPATGDVFTLKATPYRGNIQWQSSTDGNIWNDLTGQSNSQVNIPTNTEAFYRAKITDGTCFVTYSDSAVVLLPHTQNVTVDPKTLTGTTLLKSDSVSYSYISNGSTTVKPGTILLNTDSVSGINIVSGTVQKGDTITVQTTQGTMADLFVNQSFKLSTSASSNAQSIKGLTGAQLSRALTDTNGFIHPAAVVDNNISAAKVVSTTEQTDNIPLVSFGKDFSGQDIYNENGLQLQFSSGYYNFNSELKCEFDFEQLKFDLAKLKITGGALKRFSFYTDPAVTGIDAKLVLLAKAGGAATFEKEKTLAKNVFNKSFKFLVGEIPVWMDVTMDLMAKATGSISSELSVSGGASASAHLKLGATYQNGVWTPDTSFVKTFTLEGPTVTGKANEKLQVEVYPHISVKFYKIVGPYLDIAPYTREEMNLSISGNYDFGLYMGTNARIGINVEAFDKNVADWNHEFNLKEKELYKVPKKLKLISGDKQNGEAGNSLNTPVVFQAVDSKGNGVANYLINLFTSKSISAIKAENGQVQADETVIKTDNSGKISYIWKIPADADGDQSLQAYLKDGKDTKILTSDTTATSSVCNCTKKYGTFTDSRDGHVYKSITIGTQTWMAENLAYLPNVSGINDYSSTNPLYYIYDYKALGVLYNWPAASTACPVGWHLSSEEEWVELETLFGINTGQTNGGWYLIDSIGNKIRSTNGWIRNNPLTTNESCFSALPSGEHQYKHFNDGDHGYFYVDGNCAFFWTNTKYNNSNACYRYLNSGPYLYRPQNGGCGLDNGFAVRCVKN